MKNGLSECPGILSQAPFLISAVPSGQAGPDRTQMSMDMASKLVNLYPEIETDPEPVFAHPGPVHASDSSTGPLSTSAQDYIPPKQVEEGELSDPDDQPDPDPD